MFTKENARFRGPKESEKYVRCAAEISAGGQKEKKKQQNIKAMMATMRKEWRKGTNVLDDEITIVKIIEIDGYEKKIQIRKEDEEREIQSIMIEYKVDGLWEMIPQSEISFDGMWIFLDEETGFDTQLRITWNEQKVRVGSFEKGEEEMSESLKSAWSRVEKIRLRCMQHEVSDI